MKISTENKNSIIWGAGIVFSVGIAYFLIRKYVLKHRLALQFFAKVDRLKWKGKKETDLSISDELVRYWKKAGKNFTETQMQNKSFHSSYPWSSVYIGHLVNLAGFQNFDSTSSHSEYVVKAKSDRKNKKKYSFWAYKPIEGKKVEIGDILVKGRSGSKPNLDNITSGVISHGDIVIDIASKDGQKYAIAQGGNVGDTVARTKYKLDSKGRLLNPVHFAQLKYEL